MGASVSLPTKVNSPLHQKKSINPASRGSKPISQIDGTSLTASPDDCNKSQGTTPATVPGTRIVKKSDLRATMTGLLYLQFATHQALTGSGPADLICTNASRLPNVRKISQ